MFRGPLGNVRVKTFPVLHHRSEQEQIAAPLQLALQMRAQLIARLRLYGNLARGAKLRAEPREEQANEMINLRDGCHSALAAAACRALFDADRGRNARDEIHIG